jgi:hypothetical protein
MTVKTAHSQGETKDETTGHVMTSRRLLSDNHVIDVHVR